VLLSGEPGIGKSRIAAAVEEAIRNEPHVRLHYYCSPHHTGSALYPIVSQLERAAGFGRDDTVDTKLTKLETLLAKSATSAEDIALLAELSSLPAEGRYPPLGLSPKQKRVRTLTALLRQLDTLSRRCPVLMLFEDAHWADPTSLEVLNLAVERAQQLPVLILVTFRPEFRPPWIGQPHVTALTIARLQRSEGAALAELVAGKQLPADILDQIVTRTDGVPLFLEELTKAVLESGLLREQDGCHVLDRPPQGLVIPTSLQASLIARLDRLAPEKDVIQTGAAIGREFSYEVLAAVVALPQDHLRTALERLVSAELIFARGTPPDATYLFKHALVQDAAYATLLRSRRQQLHARIAAVLEEHFADVVEAQPEILAHHCAQARLSAKAIAYGQKAGDLAIRRSAMTEAIGHLTRALDLLETLPDDRQRNTFEFRLQLARAGALLQASGWASPQMGEAYSRARELSRKLDDIPELEVVLALFGQWTFHHNRAELDTAREIAEELLFLKTMHAGALTPALAHRAIGSGLMFRGQFENARTELELALSYYEPSVHEAPTFFGSANTRVVALSFMAWIRLFQGDIAAAHTASREALERARDLTSPYSLAFTVHTKCLFNQVVGNPSSVQDYSAQLVALATEQGYRHLLATATFFQGWAAFVEGHIELGVANMQRGLAAKREGGAEIKVPYYLGLLAESYRQLGRAGDALLLLTDALDRVERTGERWFEAELHRLKAEVLMGHPACSGVEAEASLARALSIARGQAARLWELRASASLARLWRDQGRHADARELLAPVLGRFTKGVDQPDLRHACELLDTVRQ
jgi:predicted ATPase